jgi:histone H3/H4
MENENTTEETGKTVLVVASKLKNYIREQSGMNTSAAVMDRLSEKVRGLCNEAIENAKREGRKTVMDRDFP